MNGSHETRIDAAALALRHPIFFGAQFFFLLLGVADFLTEIARAYASTGAAPGFVESVAKAAIASVIFTWFIRRGSGRPRSGQPAA